LMLLNFFIFSDLTLARIDNKNVLNFLVLADLILHSLPRSPTQQEAAPITASDFS
jgi:hypothetical protein